MSEMAAANKSLHLTGKRRILSETTRPAGELCVMRISKKRRLIIVFSLRQKREIADKVQAILRETNHPELPKEEIKFQLHVKGAEAWSWADIRNNKTVTNPGINSWNERQDPHNKSLDPDA